MGFEPMTSRLTAEVAVQLLLFPPPQIILVARPQDGQDFVVRTGLEPVWISVPR